MEETEKRPMIIAEVPRQKHKVNCKTCKQDFLTPYSYQIYCRNPCKLPYAKKPKKPKVVRQTNLQARKKRAIKAEKERQHTLNNRKWLSMKL